MVFYKQGDTINDPLVYKAEIDFIKYDNKEDLSFTTNTITKNIKIMLK